MILPSGQEIAELDGAAKRVAGQLGRHGIHEDVDLGDAREDQAIG